MDNKILFICGLHKSGTSLLHSILKKHPQISGFEDTGVPKDEGQHLQNVFPPAIKFGGPGKFGFKKKAHITESSPLISKKNREKLFAQWGKYWDTDKEILIEKSPPNIIRTRFFQEMFPGSYFVIILRHPVAVSLATRRWWRWIFFSINSLINHWVKCYNLFERDRQYLNNYMIIKYENFISAPQEYINNICEFAGINSFKPEINVDSGVNQKYFERYLKARKNIFFKNRIKKTINKFETEVNAFGYSLKDLLKNEEYR